VFRPLGAFFLLGPLLAACSSNESVICERLEACELLPSGLNASDCEEEAASQVSEERLGRCAECVEREDCEAIPEACREDCQPGD